jgi:uncharacterized protein (DUF433 family)
MRLGADMERRSLDSHIVETPGTCGGRPRIAGRRIRVQDVAIWHEEGVSVKEMQTEYDLDLADIYAALAFYYDNRAEIDKNIADDEVFIEEMKKKYSSRIAEKLRALELEKGDGTSMKEKD